MLSAVKTLAVYTTVYPGIEPYLKDWCRSVLEQTDRDYQLWIGVDALEPGTIKEALGASVKAIWVAAASGETPAQIRQRAMSQIVRTCDGVVLVDSDDILHPSRVSAARTALQTSDLAGCALRLVDQQGRDLGTTFGLPAQARPENVFPRNNVFGLSNSAFRSDLLRRCLPIPTAAVLVDWYLSTKAWLFGASLSFDPVARMDYRQHSANMAKVCAPFKSAQVARDTERVMQHFQMICSTTLEDCIPERISKTERVAADVEFFYRQIVLRPNRLEDYVRKLNDLDPAPLWWSCVAHPSLNQMWMQ